MIREKISTMIQEAIDGNTSCCEVHAELKQIETLLKAGLGAIQSGVVDEAREFTKGDKYYGGTWQVKSTATILDFSKDPEYVELNAKASARKKALGAAWKAKNEGRGFFDEASGESIPILPVKSSGKEIAVWIQSKPKQMAEESKKDKWSFPEGEELLNQK